MQKQRSGMKIILAVILLALSMLMTSCMSAADGLIDRLEAMLGDTNSDPDSDSDSDELTEVTSEDGVFSVMAPKSWEKTDELNDEAQISLMNERKELYLMCISESLLDFDDSATVDDYFALVKESMSGSIENAVWTEPAAETLNGASAISVELSGTINKVKITYFITLYKTESSFTQVIGWTIFSKTDANRAIITEVAKSFRERDAT